MTRMRKMRRHRASGMAMVEMIFVLPVLLLLVFAIAEFGIMFSLWLTLSNAVREGARAGVVYRQSCNPTTVENEAKQAVRDYAAPGGVGFPPGTITVTGMCVTAPPRVLTVNATFPFTLRIPFASSLGTINLKYASTMRNE